MTYTNNILMYHNVFNSSNDPYSVSIDAFEKQLVYLVDNGYNIISMEALYDKINNNKNIKNDIVITFDDGYKDFIDNAFPILKKYNLYATVFIVYELFGKEANWSLNVKDEILMDKKDIEFICKNGMNIGSHTSSHVDMTKLSDTELQTELEKSKLFLEEYKQSIISFSFPWGRYGRREVLYLEKSGFDCACIVGNDSLCFDKCLYQLNRITMKKDMTLNSLQKELKKSMFTNVFKKIAKKVLRR